MLCASNTSQQIKSVSQPRATQNSFSSLSSRPEKTFVQQQKRDEQKIIVPSASKCCTTALTPSGHPQSDAITSSRTQTSDAHQSNADAVMTAGISTVGNILDSNAFPSRSFTCPEIADYNSTTDSATHADAGESSNSGAIYSSFFFLSQTHDYPAAESQSGTVRPVQSCQENMEDTSSSDDEGKLIIEL